MMNMDIKDIKSPLDIPMQWMWLWIVLGVIAVVAVIICLIVLYFRRSRVQGTLQRTPLSAWEKAYARLENLRLKKIMDRHFLKPFYIELSDIIRHYLEERFLIKAPEMTTEEFLDSLKNSPALSDTQQQILRNFLSICDMVKFAQHSSSTAEAEESFNLVKSLIDQTHGT